ncbi:hypothetical protein A0U91_16695 (plasmid) [Acetobacter persici]|uniref:Uncharacterized protein n=1 Tax=Acetobacter persici TaxID=1076596 RepID=A0A1U9LJL7_9PROT|nr:hypothetical protein A0U91_16695 [Acetobacter persici]
MTAKNIGLLHRKASAQHAAGHSDKKRKVALAECAPEQHVHVITVKPLDASGEFVSWRSHRFTLRQPSALLCMQQGAAQDLYLPVRHMPLPGPHDPLELLMAFID